MKSHLRSFLKSISWRIFATSTTMLITYGITHELVFAFYVGIFEFFSKIVLYYAHERLWERIGLGLK